MCPPHASAQAARTAASDARRGSAHQRGYTKAWARARARFLREHPLCVMCAPGTAPHAATEVDHRIPHRGDQALFWDEGNWQGGCKPAHSAKTARENGGFGNAVRQAVQEARG